MNINDNMTVYILKSETKSDYILKFVTASDNGSRFKVNFRTVIR